MNSSLRKLNLTAHVAFSVGWLGAVASFLVLSIAGLTSRNAEIVRSAYLSMNLIGQFIIVPLSFATLLTGLVQSLGTRWGLFRYYWVFVKFILAIGATFLLLLHQFTAVAGAARRVSGAPMGALPEVGHIGIQLVVDAGLAIMVLLVATTLSVYKPWGRTPYGQRERVQEQRTPGSVITNAENDAIGDGVPAGLKFFLAALGAVVLLLVVLRHVTGGGFASHGH